MKRQCTMVLLLLAGCGSTAAPESNRDGTALAAKTGGNTPPPNWNALDACSVIDKAEMAAIVGKSVEETALGLIHESDGTTAATSECTYTLQGGGKTSLMMRWSPIADNSEGAINSTRSGLEQTVKAFGGKIEIVEKLGKAAFWVGLTSSLNVYIGDDKFVIINMPSGSTSKDQAIALARKMGA